MARIDGEWLQRAETRRIFAALTAQGAQARFVGGCVRDTLAKRPTYLFDEQLSAPLFNGTRLQIYPTGGGFMTAHTDLRAINNAKSLSPDYIQLVLLVTEKGQDYASGGAYVEQDGQRIDVEAHSRSGDILVYDGNTLHGVADIDTHLPLATTPAGGRIVALATIYN